MEEYTREQLLRIISSYLKQIKRSGKEFPTVVLDDLRCSMEYILEQNGIEVK